METRISIDSFMGAGKRQTKGDTFQLDGLGVGVDPSTCRLKLQM